MSVKSETEIKLSTILDFAKNYDVVRVINDVNGPTPGPTPPTPEPPKPEPPPEKVYSKHYSHYNPVSWDGRGCSIIFCPDSPWYTAVTLNGAPLRCHTRNDRGRAIWTNYDFQKAAPTRVAGEIVATRSDGKKDYFKVTGEGTYMDHRGDCFGKYAVAAESDLITMKDGSKVADPRCGRIPYLDPRSLDHRVSSVMPADTELVPIVHKHGEAVDQGREGMCTGTGCVNYLRAYPYAALGLDVQYAKEIVYWGAQKIDPWPGGSYPHAWPKYEGSSVLAAIKMLQNLGWITSYHAAKTMWEIKAGLTGRPGITGLTMTEGMMRPDKDHYMHCTGEEVGGHCMCLLGWFVRADGASVFVFWQSWGKDFGDHGVVYMTEEEFDKARANGGEVYFPDLREPA